MHLDIKKDTGEVIVALEAHNDVLLSEREPNLRYTQLCQDIKDILSL